MESKTNSELLQMRERHVPKGPFNVTPIFVNKASGCVIEDVEGKEYIDFAGGIGVMNVGYGAEKVINAIKEQAEQYTHTCFHIVMYEPYIELAKKLNEITPGDFPKKSFFVNSGAEAVENAIKVARYATQRSGIIAFENAFHGRTYMTMSLTSKVKPYKWGFAPYCPEIYRARFAYCYRCPFGLEYPGCDVACADYLEEFFISNVSADSVAAIIAEPIQGEGGFVTPPPEYFKKIKAICEKHGILLIMDEIQSGMGRTGTMFASEHYGVAPDIITTAKSLGGGLPLAGITGRAELMEAPHVGALGGTYGGNPVACKAALAVLDTLQEELLDKAVALGDKARSRLLDLQKEYEIIGDVRGLGPMLGIELVKDRETKQPAAEEAKKLTAWCLDKGLILLSCGNFGNVIRTLMPLVITDEQLDKGFSIMEEGLKHISGK